MVHVSNSVPGWNNAEVFKLMFKQCKRDYRRSHNPVVKIEPNDVIRIYASSSENEESSPLPKKRSSSEKTSQPPPPEITDVILTDVENSAVDSSTAASSVVVSKKKAKTTSVNKPPSSVRVTRQGVVNTSPSKHLWTLEDYKISVWMRLKNGDGMYHFVYNSLRD